MVLFDGDHGSLSVKLRDCQFFSGTQFVPTGLHWYPLWLFTWSFGYSSTTSDGSPYEKRVDAKGHVLSDECIADEVPFGELPEGWAWVRLGTICRKLTDGSHNPPPKRPNGYPVISATNISNRTVDLGFIIRYCDENGFQKENPRTQIKQGDIVLGIIGGSIGNVGIFQSNKKVIAQRSVAIIDSIGCNSYLSWALESPLFNGYYKNAVGTAQGGIYLQSLSSMFVPLPPMAEQHRIVERINQLMPLVEEYGELEDAREELDAALPSRLRKSVLQMAVQGKLVPQDPADEPASALLERIREQRRQLVAEKKMKAPKGGESIIFRGSDGRRYEKRVDAKGRESEPTCIEDEIPFETPDSWEWARLSSVLQLNSGLGYKKDNLAVKGEKMIRVLRGGNIGEEDEPLIKNNDVMISAEFVDDNILLRDGQILTPSVTSLENVGKTAIIRNTDGNTVCGGFVFFLTPFLIDPCHSEYLHRYLASPAHISFCKSSVKKSGQAFYNLSKASLNSALIAIPPLAEQHRIVERVAEFMSLVTNQ